MVQYEYRQAILKSYGLLCVRCIASYLSLRREASLSVPGPEMAKLQADPGCLVTLFRLIRHMIHMCRVTVRFDHFSG